MIGCGREDAVSAAAMAGRLEGDLAAHARSCRACGDAVLAARFLNASASMLPADRPLPDPGRIYWRAQLLARRAAAEKAARPIAWMERAGVASLVVVAAVVLTWVVPVVRTWAAALNPAAAATAVAPTLSTGLVVVLGLGALPALLVMAVWNASRAAR